MPDVPENLLAGRRAIDGLLGVELLEDWEWFNEKSFWVLKCSLTIDSEHPYVPSKTIWFITVDPIYPEGNIEFYPSKIGGLATTFQHQNNNRDGFPDLPWRTGNICLHSQFHHIGQFCITDEPLDDPHMRIKWRFERALAWLMAAARDELVKSGDPFELPHIPLSPRLDKSVLFIEDPVSFESWSKIAVRMGFVEFVTLNQQPSVVFPTSFKSMAGETLFRPNWGNGITENGSRGFQGLWLLLERPPILPVWHIPNNWNELKTVLNDQGASITECIKPLKQQLKREPALFLIGFPIMDRIGDELSQIHWTAIELPTSATKDKTKRIKANYVGHYDKAYMKEDGEVPWLKTENCHYSRVSVRGKLHKEVVENEVLLIGLGAIGSLIAEQLARAGHSKIALMDQDIVAAGNIVRHTLGLESVTKKKSQAIHDKLLLISPHLDVDIIEEVFPPKNEKNIKAVKRYPIIIDCTADRELRYQLGAFPWDQNKLFITIALGFKAKRLYFFSVIDESFPVETFNNLIQPWLEKEKPEYIDDGFPREGIGCWHPIFPARVDDIWMLASAAIKQLEQTILSPLEAPQLIVFEQVVESGNFVGIQKLLNE
ncbi:ThiF family protein (plasmid) [Desulfosarcina ovata subsp. sediminis]|uniref:ThiF family protein n=1 Tax=Desulfosarcina ovata subsp. sediminis TaxID=885957 RepID=A0A5K8A252_9BACT|nr:ThiF family adenylyltransferase [Desulfosarcina ovata]BBO86675.1 ThiF family protein [Desulfosarcina ovata subsp. sediminis]